MSEQSPEPISKGTDGSSSEPPRFFDSPRNVKRTLVLLYFFCALVFGLDFVVDRHVEGPWEGLFGFYALFGFAVCVTVVLVARELRKVLMRSETYYGGEGDD
jgi:F0F1-type ATP synthase assembly protein I